MKTNFIPTNEGWELINKLHNTYVESYSDGTLIIVGSIIAAQAYPGNVYAMTPAPGYERAKEKLMSCEKFTTF